MLPKEAKLPKKSYQSNSKCYVGRIESIRTFLSNDENYTVLYFIVIMLSSRTDDTVA